MSRFRTAFARARADRAHLRAERAVQQALTGAPTVETAHELAAISARR
ncbi:hypothetical protein [Blastococcus sp. TF02A-26]|nr:hypothetical protein [Blastococcus sp. TF02A-26]